MAEKNGNGDQTAKAELTAAQVAKLVTGKVVVPALGEDGEPIVIRDKDSGRTYFKTIEKRIAAEDILGFRKLGNQVIATTVDGQKLNATIV